MSPYFAIVSALVYVSTAARIPQRSLTLEGVQSSNTKTQHSDAAHTVVVQLTAAKSSINDAPVGHDDKRKGVLPHVGVVQHSFALFVQKVQAVVVVVPVFAEESEQVTASPLVFLYPHLPHESSAEHELVYITVPG